MAEIDFDNEEAVLAEMAEELDVEADELRIREDRGYSSFGAGLVYSLTIRGGGHKEWYVIGTEDEMHDLAVAIVRQDLEEDPSMFNQRFIESHINIDQLRRDLEADLLNSRIDDLTDTADRHPDDFWDDYEREGFEAPEENDEGERPEPGQDEIEELAEKQVEHELRDPMRYLEDIYGDEAVKKAIEIAGIDIDAAAEEAVDEDGPGHFLSSYDGEYHETENGLFYWRHN